MIYKTPEIFKITVKKQAEETYKLEYIEGSIENEENKKTVEATFDIAKKIIPAKLEIVRFDGYIGLKFTLEAKIKEVADIIAGEFLGLSTLGTISLGELFVLFSMKKSQEKK